MLPRVTAAISQFIAPIASAAKRTAVGERQESNGSPSGFQRQSKRNLKIVRTEPGPEPQQPLQVAKPPMGATVTFAFIQLLNAIQRHRGSLMRWLGPRAYRSALQEQKQAGKFRKGAMLDTKAE